jgi:hypothetical protein
MTEYLVTALMDTVCGLLLGAVLVQESHREFSSVKQCANEWTKLKAMKEGNIFKPHFYRISASMLITTPAGYLHFRNFCRPDVCA